MRVPNDWSLAEIEAKAPALINDRLKDVELPAVHLRGNFLPSRNTETGETICVFDWAPDAVSRL